MISMGGEQGQARLCGHIINMVQDLLGLNKHFFNKKKTFKPFRYLCSLVEDSLVCNQEFILMQEEGKGLMSHKQTVFVLGERGCFAFSKC